MYSILNTLSEYTYFYKSKTLLHTLFCLFLKSSKAFCVSLTIFINVYKETMHKVAVGTDGPHAQITSGNETETLSK